MKKNLFLLPLVISVALLFAGCPCGDDEMQEKEFDEETFLSMQEKWKSLEIKNYNFSYECTRSSGRVIYSATVNVKDGVGTVEKSLTYDCPADKILSPIYYIHSIEEAYKHIWDFYIDKKERVKTGELWRVFTDERAGYNKEYFYPTVRTHYMPNNFYNAQGEYEPNDFWFIVTDFKLMD